MLKKALTGVRVAAFYLPLVLVTSCGGSGDSAPNGGSITSSPAGYSVSVPFTTVTSTFQSSPFPFTIALKTASGAPVSNTAVYVIASSPTWIYVTDPSTGITTGPVVTSAPYPVYTDVSGAIQIQVSIPLTSNSSYGDTISFASGNLRVNNTITVECVDSLAGICP